MSDITVLHLATGFLINLAVALVIVCAIYYPSQHDRNMVFTYLAFNTVIYFMMAILSSVELGIGVGFGLFAVFSVLRYRTVEMSSREITYLFIVIALPVMFAVGAQTEQWLLLGGVGILIMALLWVLELGWGFSYETTQHIKYDRLDLLHTAQRTALLADLGDRLGISITRIEIQRIDMLEETAILKLWYVGEARSIQSPGVTGPSERIALAAADMQRT
jgi:hypothetical protein